MIVTPNHALFSRLAGRIGTVVLQPLRSRHIARRPWTIRAPVTSAQATHRLAFARAAALYQSVPLDIRPAWLPYAGGLGYGPYAAWQHLNTPLIKAALPTCLAPPNPAYVPVTAPNWESAYYSRVAATWTYAGPPATVAVSTYYRNADTYRWTYDATVDAVDEQRTIQGLVADDLYDAALIPHNPAKTTFAQAYHELVTAGGIGYEDFLTYTELDTYDQIEVESRACHAVALQRERDCWLYDDKGIDHFGATFQHDFTWYWQAAEPAAMACLWAVSNSIEDDAYWWSTNQQALDLRLYKGNGITRLSFANAETHEEHWADDYSINTTYYLTVERTSETAIQARIYLDPERTDLFHSHNLVISTGRRYRYLFAINSWDTNGPNRSWFTVRDLCLHEEE